MKKLIAALVLLFVTNNIISQEYKAQMSELINANIGEPVLLMKNGMTVFAFRDEKQQKLFISTFNSSHNTVLKQSEVAFKNITFAYHPSLPYNSSAPTKQESRLAAWYEFNGKIVLYIEAEKPYRVVIDPISGAVEEELVIEPFLHPNGDDCTDDKSKSDDYKAKRTCLPILWSWTIDKKTGNYLATYSTRLLFSRAQAESRTNFDGVTSLNWKLINPANHVIDSIEPDYMNGRFNDVNIHTRYWDGDNLYFLWEFNKMTDQATYDGKGGIIYFSKYDLKTKKYTHKELFDTKDKDFFGTKVFPSVDKSSFTIRFVTEAGREKETILYDIFYLTIDAATLKTSDFFRLQSEKLNAFVKENCKMPKGYMDGMTDHFLLGQKGNILTTTVKNAISTYYSGYIYTVNPEIVGVSSYDNKGKEINAWAFPYNNYGTTLRESSVTPPVKTPQLDFSYALATGTTNNYIFLNDLPENINAPLDKKPEYARLPNECTAMAVELMPNGTVKKYYLFGESADLKTNKYGEFKYAMYDQANNTLIVKVFEGAGRKNSYAAWIKLN